MKYRIVHYFEDCAKAECISCKEHFTLGDEEIYNFCPKCGVVIEPEKQNKRWNTYSYEKNYKLNNEGRICETFSPHIIIETQTVVNRSLDLDHFCLIEHPNKKLPWRLHCHAKLGCFIGGVSSSKWFMNKFQEISNKYDGVRLLIMNGTNTRIIKEHERD